MAQHLAGTAGGALLTPLLLLSQLVKDYEEPAAINTQLEKMCVPTTTGPSSVGAGAAEEPFWRPLWMQGLQYWPAAGGGILGQDGRATSVVTCATQSAPLRLILAWQFLSLDL